MHFLRNNKLFLKGILFYLNGLKSVIEKEYFMFTVKNNISGFF